MVTRNSRLLKHADFDRVYRQGGRILSANMTVFFRRRAAQDAHRGLRVGFTVGRAVGGAVERNRIRRRMRAAVRLHLARLTEAIDVVINPRQAARTVDFGQLQQEVQRAFEKIVERRGR